MRVKCALSLAPVFVAILFKPPIDHEDSKSVHQQEELQMLHSEIFCNYEKNCLNLKRKMTLLAESKPESPTPDCPGRIRIFQMDGADFLKDMELRAEAFGPCSIIVSVQDESQLIEITEH